MVAYNFQSQFANDVEAGIKAHTIRRAGKRKPPNVGDELQLYTGMRTAKCRLLRRATCKQVQQIMIDSERGWVVIFESDYSPPQWMPLTGLALGQLIVGDGFDSEEAFFKYFSSENGETFEGYLIRWSLQCRQ